MKRTTVVIQHINNVPQEVLDNARIPALSAAWSKDGKAFSLAAGKIDADKTKNADELTLFQAASLSKPVSAAIILDLVAEGKWNLDKPLVEMGVSFGSPDMNKDARNAKLTTRMIIAQCSGLPNWFYAKPETFIAEPGTHFTYSGIAYECLKEVMEKILGKTWEKLAQDFFQKVGMQHSTFQLPQNTHLRESAIARGFLSDNTLEPLLPPQGFKELPAATLLTTAQDYLRFLSYCHTHLTMHDLFKSHTRLNPADNSNEACEKISWGMGMGLYTDGDKEIAFHWGNHAGGHAFFAMDKKTGEAIACFVNSPNGSNVFQLLSENIVGNMQPVFKWLSDNCNFHAAVKPSSSAKLKEWADNVVLQPLANKEEERDAVSTKALLTAKDGLFTQKMSKDDSALQLSKEKKSQEDQLKRSNSSDDIRNLGNK